MTIHRTPRKLRGLCVAAKTVRRVDRPFEPKVVLCCLPLDHPGDWHAGGFHVMNGKAAPWKHPKQDIDLICVWKPGSQWAGWVRLQEATDEVRRMDKLPSGPPR